jgi:hypothetical protein
MQKIAVVVNMDSQVMKGTFVLQDGKRLSDFLNERYPGNGELEVSPFLTLTDVTIHHHDGRIETADTMYVNHKVIQMLRTQGENDARGLASETRTFPYMLKLKVKATIYTTDCKLTGYLYCKEKQDIGNLLSLRRPFMPCSDVQIHDFQSNITENAAFVAVNSNLVFSVKKEVETKSTI